MGKNVGSGPRLGRPPCPERGGKVAFLPLKKHVSPSKGEDLVKRLRGRNLSKEWIAPLRGTTVLVSGRFQGKKRRVKAVSRPRKKRSFNHKGRPPPPQKTTERNPEEEEGFVILLGGNA